MVFELEVILTCWAINWYSWLALQDAFQSTLWVKLTLSLELLRWRTPRATRSLSMLLARDIERHWLHGSSQIIDAISPHTHGFLHLLVYLARPICDRIINPPNLQLFLRCSLVNSLHLTSLRVLPRQVMVLDRLRIRRSNPLRNALSRGILGYDILKVNGNGILLPILMLLLLPIMPHNLFSLLMDEVRLLWYC